MAEPVTREELETLLQEFKRSFRGKAIDQAAQWAVAGAVSLLTIAILGWGFYLNEKLPGWVGGVPRDAVIAFDHSGGCKSLGAGWDEANYLAGKFIVGAKDQDHDFSFNTSRDERGVELTAANMPKIYLGYRDHVAFNETPYVHEPTSIGFAPPSEGAALRRRKR